MKVYKIKVNGKSYRVELESLEEVKEASNAPVASMPGKPEEKKEAPKEAPKSLESGEKVLSPIQGQVTGVKVKVGDKVKKGDVLFIVEAMKLENEVVSPFEGEVKQILVEKGKNVASKEPLAIIG